ncbi:hypothetical protein CJP74_01760 [Psittacicella melopsittaci]|uniref:Uncharacterized protein n=1 Tax=Psittacicella melopsittaci TaxID=2028576 RepID=A0A3A1Y840_9GAMM|nr:hypothetical protein [Psittacicella melopsittaci]RIY33476.1 hypothetical protein CJP74_01760 [Psittacicella melopsittaci]
MLSKPLLTIALALTSLGVIATPNYSNYSDKQLQQEFQRLEKLNTDTVTNLRTKLVNFVRVNGGKQLTAQSFLRLASTQLLADFNQYYSLQGLTYTSDPRITNLVNLSQVCLEFIARGQDFAQLSQSCKTVSRLYVIAELNSNALYSLALFGTLFKVADLEDKKQPLTTKQKALLQIPKNPGAYKLGFALYIPGNRLYADASTRQTIETIYKVQLIAD